MDEKFEVILIQSGNTIKVYKPTLDEAEKYAHESAQGMNEYDDLFSVTYRRIS